MGLSSSLLAYRGHGRRARDIGSEHQGSPEAPRPVPGGACRSRRDRPHVCLGHRTAGEEPDDYRCRQVRRSARHHHGGPADRPIRVTCAGAELAKPRPSRAPKPNVPHITPRRCPSERPTGAFLVALAQWAAQWCPRLLPRLRWRQKRGGGGLTTAARFEQVWQVFARPCGQIKPGKPA